MRSKTSSMSSSPVYSPALPPSWPVKIGCCKGTSGTSAAFSPGTRPDPTSSAAIGGETDEHTFPVGWHPQGAVEPAGPTPSLRRGTWKLTSVSTPTASGPTSHLAYRQYVSHVTNTLSSLECPRPGCRPSRGHTFYAATLRVGSESGRNVA